MNDICFVSSFCVSRTLHNTLHPTNIVVSCNLKSHMYQRNGGLINSTSIEVFVRSCCFLVLLFVICLEAYHQSVDDMKVRACTPSQCFDGTED